MKSYTDGDYLITEYDTGTIVRELVSVDNQQNYTVIINDVAFDTGSTVATVNNNFTEIDACGKSTIVTADIQVQDGSGAVVTGYSGRFRMPVSRADGRTIILPVEFVDGIATAALDFGQIGDPLGVWDITEFAINSGLTPSEQFRFAGLRIYVY